MDSFYKNPKNYQNQENLSYKIDLRRQVDWAH